VFDKICKLDIVSSNRMMKAYTYNEYITSFLKLYHQMQLEEDATLDSPSQPICYHVHS
jgi:hypothetical protein